MGWNEPFRSTWRSDVPFSLLLERSQTYVGQIWTRFTVLYISKTIRQLRKRKHMLDPQKTLIFYDGFCVPGEKRGNVLSGTRIFRARFHDHSSTWMYSFRQIDPRTGRKTNLCYRTYRLNAICVRDVQPFSLPKEVQVRPALLVRSGTGKPNWSPLDESCEDSLECGCLVWLRTLVEVQPCRENEDSDPICSNFLRKWNHRVVRKTSWSWNGQAKSTTLKWKGIYFVAKDCIQ